MEKIKLTKREYLGQGFYYNFRNLQDGTYTVDSCTEEDYKALALPNAIIPTMEGHVFESASGYTVKVDNEDEELHENEYCDYEDGYFVAANDNKGNLIGCKVTKDKIVNDEIDKNIFNIWL